MASHVLCGRAVTVLLQSLRRLPAAAVAAPDRRRHLLRSLAAAKGSQAGATAASSEASDAGGGGGAAAGIGSSSSIAPHQQPLCSTTSALGQVMAAQANFVRVRVDTLVGGQPGETAPRRRLLCVVRGLLKKMRRAVLVGDRVRLVGIDWVDGRGMVEEVLPRGSQLAEPAVANVDHVLLVFSAALPPFQPAPATRYLLSAEAAGLPVTVAINKADLVAPERLQEMVQQLSGWGYRAVPVSVVSGAGLGELTAALAGRVSVVAGPSGAGKSSIINALRLRSVGLEGTLGQMDAEASGAAASDESCSVDSDEGDGDGEKWEGEAVEECGGAGGSTEAQQQQQQPRPGGSGGGSSRASAAAAPVEVPELQAVGQVSERIGRGKHTTRNVTLLELELEAGSGGGGAGEPGSGAGAGLVVDTPGFNQPSLAFPAAELWQHFPEILQRLEESRCTYRGCQHLQEPGCVVRGEGDGSVGEGGWERYPLYRDIHAELVVLEDVEAQRQASKKRREGSVRLKSRAGGAQGEEARLETKTHRRVSRRSERQRLSNDLAQEEDVVNEGRVA